MKDCSDCGAEFEPAYAPAKTRRCRVCQVLEGLLYLGPRRYECVICDAQFVPLSTRSVACGRCRPVKSKHSATGECGVCSNEKEDLLGEDVLVCSGCATDPTNYKAIVKALARKQQERRS